MTHTLLLLLRGPMQSWGDDSRYLDRATRAQPTKSGVLGLLAAAEGRPRTASLHDLAGLTFAVRVDQPGTLLHDYQTAEQWQTGGGTRLVSRYYLTDAVFLAAVQSDSREFLEGMVEALRRPHFPLYLGRRSCPANPDLVQGIVEGTAVDALRSAPWHASITHRKTRPSEVVLPIFRDGAPGEEGDPRQDVPLSFDQAHRDYGWRTVVEEPDGVPLVNKGGNSAADPFFEAVISA
ncbi:MAG: type I-E CRISPR-associated protein Cas5/CasD [Dermabacter sp.]|nr:type I-E CRISPR-associated protein Cas5/CasD [Dermabacter sp.]